MISSVNIDDIINSICLMDGEYLVEYKAYNSNNQYWTKISKKEENAIIIIGLVLTFSLLICCWIGIRRKRSNNINVSVLEKGKI